MHEFTPYSALTGGALIGVAAAVLLLTHGRICGVSGLFAGLLRRGADARPLRLAFVVGLLVGGVVLRVVHPAAFASSWSPSWWLALPAGLLVGFGTQLGGGCTSGHGVCGVSRLAPRSLAATATFLLSGIATVFVMRHLVRGGS